ncbi:MAG: crotonase/enoyl-CoA hydratase family protein [Actinomycetota bacterium]|nr:crotonase/enoyl-CoA hydratase family protein [Actinomycetota bacterium]
MTVRFERIGAVGVITLDRPEARNAVDGDLARGLDDAINRVESDPEIWVAILAAEGPVFSAGADLKAIAAGRTAELRTEHGFAGLTRWERTKPLIAAVDGPALAGGLELVLSCDLVVASSNASFGIPEVKRSLVAGAGGLFRLPRALPRNVALELGLTGDPISAERAHTLGLVSELAAPGEALAVALRLAGRIVANAPLAVRETRRVMLAADASTDLERWAQSEEAMRRVASSEDAAEGPRAFIEKRAPVWTGR